MQKLDPVQIAWIIRQKDMRVKNDKIAQSLNISTRWVQKIYSRHKSNKHLILKLGRSKKIITESTADVVIKTYQKYRYSAVPLERLLDVAPIHMPHNSILEELKLVFWVAILIYPFIKSEVLNI